MSYAAGYFPYNFDRDEVLRMTHYMTRLVEALEYYHLKDMEVDFESGNMFCCSVNPKTGIVSWGSEPLPFTSYQFGGLVITDDKLIEALKNASRSKQILNPDGSIRSGILEARVRGVLFDSSNGRNNYDLEVCQKVLCHGFWPDIISSDMNTSGYYLQPLHSLPRVMSKYLDMGMSLEAVLDTVTIHPAQALKQPELASLEAGTVADLTIFKVKEKEMQYFDMNGHTFTGTQIIEPQMTIKGGKVAYCQADFT